MLTGSQPLDPERCGKLNLGNDSEAYKKPVVVSQRMGDFFDRLSDETLIEKIFSNIAWQFKRISYAFDDMKRTIRNCFVWFKVMPKLYQWEGYDGMLRVMVAHLRDYIKYEEKYGHSVKEQRDHKIATATEAIKLLRRIRKSDDYFHRRLYQVEKRYPKYKKLISDYEDGGGSYEGHYVAQGNGWVGEGGYFEFVDGNFEKAVSPDINETERLIAEIKRYHEDFENAMKQEKIDFEKDFDRLAKLLKENMYSWWD